MLFYRYFLRLPQSLTEIKTLGAIGCDINKGGLLSIGKLNVVTIIFTTISDFTINGKTLITGIPNVDYFKCDAFDPNTGNIYAMYIQDGAIKNISKIPKGVRLYLTVAFLNI